MPTEYNVGSGFTEGELQFASFWVRNGELIRKIVFGVLIAVNIFVWGYSAWGIIDAYAISYPRESRIIEEISQNEFLARSLESNRPKSIQTRPAQVFEGTEGRLDMIVPIENPNDQWYAEFTYRFNVSGEQTPLRSGFILPKQASYVGEYGFAPATAGGKTAALVVDHIVWKRVDPAVVGSDVGAWMRDRNAFEFSDISFTENVRSGSGSASRTTVTVSNPSAYGYWSVGVYINLLRAGTLVGSTYVTLTEFKPGETRTVNVDWFERLPAVTETVVTPSVNFFDESVYLPTTKF